MIFLDIVAVDVVAEKGPTGRARMCCRSKPTGEQRRATRRGGRLLGCWQALLPHRRPAIPSRARRFRRKPGVPPDLYPIRRVRTCSKQFPAYKDTCKHKSEPWSAPRDDSCIVFKEPIESRCQIGSASIQILMNKANNYGKDLLQLNLNDLIHDGKSFTARSERPTHNWA